MVQIGTLLLQHIPLLNETWLNVKENEWSCVIFAHGLKQFVMLPSLNFSRSAPRVIIRTRQFTNLSILKFISACNFLILSYFSFSHVCDDFCISFFCWRVAFSVPPMYLGSCSLWGVLVARYGSFLKIHWIFAWTKNESVLS